MDVLMHGRKPPARELLIKPSGIVRARESSDTSEMLDRDVLQATQFIARHAVEDLNVNDARARLNVSPALAGAPFPTGTGPLPARRNRACAAGRGETVAG